MGPSCFSKLEEPIEPTSLQSLREEGPKGRARLLWCIGGRSYVSAVNEWHGEAAAMTDTEGGAVVVWGEAR